MQELIAVVGMSGLFPAAQDVDALWSMMVRGHSAACPATASEWGWLPPLSQEAKPDHARSHVACSLGLDLTPEDLAWRCAQGLPGLERIQPTRSMICLGHIALPTAQANAAALAAAHGQGPQSWAADLTHAPARLLAQQLAWQGPAWCCDSACASGLYAVAAAAAELRAGRVDAAIAGGLSLADGLYTQMGFSALGALSPSGQCRPFDAAADGLLVGQGCALVLLKRLSDAWRDGDQVLAVISGEGLSTDRGGSLFAPESAGQIRALHAAYAAAGWDAQSVQHIECHGTGTPKGDAVEIASLSALWKGQTQGCVLGSVKSNIGHLLTGAGAAGLIKTLLALREQILPPTAGFHTPGAALAASPFRVLSQATPWQPANYGRRAAVSAFGFGGINAHILVGEAPARSPSLVVHHQPQQPDIAIIGLGLRVGPWQGIEQAGPRLLGHDDGIQLDQADLSAGTIALPFTRLRTPPAELATLSGQQALLLAATLDAADDAGLDLSQARDRWACFIGISQDGSATAFRSRWLGQHDAAPALDADRVMGNLGGIAASRVARLLRVGGPSGTVQSGPASVLHAAQRAAALIRDGVIDAAVIGAVDIRSDPRLGGSGPAQADCAVSFILKRSDLSDRDGDSVWGLLTDAALPAAPSVNFNDLSASSRLGHTGAAGGGLALAQALLALSQRTLPPADDALPRPWLADREQGPRHALVSSGGNGEPAAQLCLREAKSQARMQEHPLPWPAQLCLLPGGSDFSHAEQDLRQALRSQPWPQAARSWRQHQELPEHGARVGLLARSKQEAEALLTEAAAAVAAGTRIARAELRVEPEPLGAASSAWVFPGSGNLQSQLGRRLALAWPRVLAALDQDNRYVASQFAQGALWQDSFDPNDCSRSLFAQVWLGTFAHDCAVAAGVHAQRALGHSLGETASLFATRTWRDRDGMLGRLKTTALFTRDLAGPCLAAAKAYGLEAPVRWRLGVVARSRKAVEAALGARERVHLLMVNAPEECVIGGESAALHQFLADTGWPFLELSGITSVHCPAAAPVADDYRDLHRWPCMPPTGLRIWGGKRGYIPSTDLCADSIVTQALGTVDWTASVEDAYHDGARLFLEMGPGASCTRTTPRILGERRAVAVAALPEPQHEVRAFLSLCLAAAVHGHLLDLQRLDDSWQVRRQKWGPTISVPAYLPLFRELPMSVSRVSTVTKTPGAALPKALPPVALGQAAAAQSAFLALSSRRQSMVHELAQRALALASGQASALLIPEIPRPAAEHHSAVPRQLDRASCMRFAVGGIGEVLGPLFADIDAFPSRVRLPDEPLMLVDRILAIEGEPHSLASGRVITEKDVRAGDWYLDGGVMPTAICVESGQADLFLSGFLGIDRITKGLANYRLLDATVVFHGPLPAAGAVIRYDIRIHRFFRQGDTWLFRFAFTSTVRDASGERPLLDMRDGIAGFFSPAELAAGKGVVIPSIEQRPVPGVISGGFAPFIPWTAVESYSDAQLDALRAGDLAGCFGSAFARAPRIAALPGGHMRHMRLVHRIISCTPQAGRYGLGVILGEADIHPDDWFLLCHFIDDHVMPGTLMYECCLHTLRVLLLRLGWVPLDSELICEPKPGVASTLRCRGQVTAHTKKVRYELILKEIGYDEQGQAYAIADALMHADGKAVVHMLDMSVTLRGCTSERYAQLWNSVAPSQQLALAPVGQRGTRDDEAALSAQTRARVGSLSPHYDVRPALYGPQQILAYSNGAPSQGFGAPYAIFDDPQGRKLARLPGPPYQFMDRVERIEGCQAFVMQAGGDIDAAYDVPADAWYFSAYPETTMPFCVLLETALQPCGWLSAYVGSALSSTQDLRYRNLGGKAVQYRPITPDSGTLRTRVRMTSCSNSGGMVIQQFQLELSDREGLLYSGETMFGFFTAGALANQVGLREAKPFRPSADERALAARQARPYPQETDDAQPMLAMIDQVTALADCGGPQGLGWAEGTLTLDPSRWYFTAHFYQDPVTPGSLGLESFLQLLRLLARRRFGAGAICHPALGEPHRWLYRGQVIPSDTRVTVQCWITRVEGQRLWGDGYLGVDGRIIYEMREFCCSLSC